MMSVFGTKYVVDTNVLSNLGRRRRGSSFFRRNAVIPEEVLHEAAGFPDLLQLRDNCYPTTPRVLELLVDIMASVPKGDTRLVDLYKNLGSADPMIVACALAGSEDDSQYLGAEEWKIVTEDVAVISKAKEFGIDVVTLSSFMEFVDNADD